MCCNGESGGEVVNATDLVDSHAGASRLVSEVLLVDGIHLGEVVHRRDEDGNLWF